MYSAAVPLVAWDPAAKGPPAARGLDAHALAALSSAAPSTAGDSRDDSSDTGSRVRSASMETGSAARAGKQGEGRSRPNRVLGRAYNQRKEARRLAHMSEVKAAVARGDKPDNLGNGGRLEAAERATGRTGQAALDAYAALVHEVPLRALAAHPKRSRDEETVDALARPPPPVCTDTLLRLADGMLRCTLCDKMATEGHMASVVHRNRAEEHAIGTLVAGRAQSVRRFTGPGHGMDGIPTKAALLTFWGDALPDLPRTAWQILRAAGSLLVGGKATRALPVDYVRGLRLGIVSYAGAGGGKYHVHNKFHYYDELPDCIDVYDTGLYGDGPNPWPHVGPPPPGQGWWPVLAVELFGTLPPWVDMGPTVPGGKKILVICFYQLLADRVEAWWLVITADF